jgi:2'-5' RNA ligase
MNPGLKKAEIYSLWLMPKGHVADELQTLVADLCRKHMTPSFQPHVTLIGSIDLPRAEAVSKTKTLARAIRPFVVKLNELAYLDEYFRCVFIKAAKTEGLMHAHSTARKMFEQKNEEDYMPHLSLVYGDLNRQTKKNIIRKITNKIEIEFLTEEIHLYYTGGQPQEWHRESIMPCFRNRP